MSKITRSFVTKETPCLLASFCSSKEEKVKRHNDKLHLESIILYMEKVMSRSDLQRTGAGGIQAFSLYPMEEEQQ